MMGKIFIESKPTPIPWYDHTYLVYQDDFGNEFIIRGGPADNATIFDFGDIEIKNNIPLVGSDDARGGDSTTQRGQVELDLNGRSAEEVWLEMQETASNIESAQIPYGKMDDNSNSVIRTILEHNGIEPTLPLNASESSIPGWDDLLDPTPDIDSENTAWDGFGEEQQNADNPDDVSGNPPTSQTEDHSSNDPLNDSDLLASGSDDPTEAYRILQRLQNEEKEETPATDNDAEHTSPLPTAEEVQQADNPDDVGEESMNPWGVTDNDAEHTSPLPSAEEVQQADNPDDVGEESMNPWGATDNDAEHTSPLPTAEEVQQADNPDDAGEESMNPWGATDNDAENAGDPANVTPESDADLEQRYLEQQLNAGTNAIREGKALVDAIEEGDDLSIIENALDLTGSLNTLSSNLTGDGRTLLSGNVTAGMNALAAGAGLLNAIEGGDDWAITSSSVNLLKGVDFLDNMGHGLLADTAEGLQSAGDQYFVGQEDAEGDQYFYEQAA